MTAIPTSHHSLKIFSHTHPRVGSTETNFVPLRLLGPCILNVKKWDQGNVGPAEAPKNEESLEEEMVLQSDNKLGLDVGGGGDDDDVVSVGGDSGGKKANAKVREQQEALLKLVGESKDGEHEEMDPELAEEQKDD